MHAILFNFLNPAYHSLMYNLSSAKAAAVNTGANNPVCYEIQHNNKCIWLIALVSIRYFFLKKLKNTACTLYYEGGAIKRKENLQANVIFPSLTHKMSSHVCIFLPLDGAFNPFETRSALSSIHYVTPFVETFS